MRTLFLASALAISASLAATPTTVQAQDAPVGTAYQTIMIRPLNAIFGNYTLEFERAMRPDQTIGVLVSTFGIGDDFDYFSLDGKYRFYLGGVALHGFSVAATGGYTGITGTDWEGNRETVGAIGVGIELGYKFVMGARQNWLFGVDIGAQRLFPVGSLRDEFGEDTDVWVAMPSGGLSIGYVFRR
jgi:hypothetical protein